MADYMTFEDVMRELQVDEEELKKLVSGGDLKAFPAEKGSGKGASLRFKKDDVQNLKKGRETEPTIILTDSDQEMGIAESSDELILDESTSDTVLNIGDIMSPEKQDEEIVFSDSTEEFSISPHDSDPEAAIPTVEVPSVGEDLGISGETDSDAALVAAKSAPELGRTTEAKAVRAPSDSAEEVLADVVPKKSAKTPARAPRTVPGSGPKMHKVPADLEEDLEVGEDEEAAVAPRKTQSGRISRSARLRAIQMKQRPSDAAWSALALVAAAILVFPGAILVNRMMGVSPDWVLRWSDKFRWLGEWMAS